MVGISHYDTALTGYQWNNINGAEDVNLLNPILKKQGFAITSLLDEQATFDNITTQLFQFLDKTKKGDIVYLHFSSHGQPVEDLNGDEEDGTDEDMLEGKPDATNENPEDVHTRGKAAGRLLLVAYFPAEGPQGETGNLEDLQTEGYANNGGDENA